MDSSVNVPFWMLAALSVLAAWAVLERMLLPGARWVLRRRVNRVIEEINSRLALRIRPFELTRRQVLVDRLLFDPEVMEAAEARAEAEGMRREEVMAEVERYAREIVPAFNAYAYFRIGYWLARALARTLYRVRLGYADEVGLSRVSPDASVVFVMNHRSNMDYVLVAYLAAGHAALSYAVGEWARVWPLQTLLRALGAYFVRRGSGNALYRKVLARYVNMATRGGVVQAVYPEGGLTRDGALGAPRLGLLGYMARAFDPTDGRDLVFVPVGINYDRVLEDRTLVGAAAARRGRLAATLTAVRFLGHNLWLALRGRWHRFGYAAVGFGAPLSLREWCAERGENLRDLDEATFGRTVSALGDALMTRAGRVIPVLPVSVVAAALLEGDGEPVAEFELKGRAWRLMQRLEARGAHVYVPRADRDYAVSVGIRMLTLRRVVRLGSDGLHVVTPGEERLLRYYANAIAHLLPGPET